MLAQSIMWRLVLLTQLISHAWCERLPPPGQVHVDSLLQWSAPPAHSHLSYTVQYLSFNTERWNNFPSCVQTQNTSCEVTANMKEAELGCVRLHVLAHGHNLTSGPAEACSLQGNSCSPEVQLSSQPGTLTVKLRGDPPLVYQHGSQMEYRLYLGREGEHLKEYGHSPSSVVIKELEEGGRYCVRVVFVFYGTPVGPPSCVKCQDIPQSEEQVQRLALALGLVFSFTGVLVVVLLVYVLLFQRKRLKEWLRVPYQEANCIKEIFTVPPQPALVYQPSGEHWDRISLIAPSGDPPLSS